jgi:hypothetical protein
MLDEKLADLDIPGRVSCPMQHGHSRLAPEVDVDPVFQQKLDRSSLLSFGGDLKEC